MHCYLRHPESLAPLHDKHQLKNWIDCIQGIHFEPHITLMLFEELHGPLKDSWKPLDPLFCFYVFALNIWGWISYIYFIDRYVAFDLFIWKCPIWKMRRWGCVGTMMVCLACEAICLSKVTTAPHKSFVRAIIETLTISACDIMGPPWQLACTVEGSLFR